MNIKELELFQVAASAAGIEYKSEERNAGAFVIVFNGGIYSQVKYALSAVATQLIKKELESIKD
jgi:hypothetical protein